MSGKPGNRLLVRMHIAHHHLLTPLAFQMLTNFSNTMDPSPHNTYATDSSCSAKSISFSPLMICTACVRGGPPNGMHKTNIRNIERHIVDVARIRYAENTYVKRPLRCSIHLSCGKWPRSSTSNNLKKFN